jgi:hypothetical protein
VNKRLGNERKHRSRADRNKSVASMENTGENHGYHGFTLTQWGQEQSRAGAIFEG